MTEKPEQTDSRSDQQAEKEICWIQDDSLIERYKNVDRPSPRSIFLAGHYVFTVCVPLAVVLKQENDYKLAQHDGN